MTDCKDGSCEYAAPLTLRRPTREATPEQRLTALASCYEARDHCISEHREQEAREWQKEINRIEDKQHGF